MLIYIVLTYLIFRVGHFLIVHRGGGRQIPPRVIGFLVLEVALVVLGIIGVAQIMSGPYGPFGNDMLRYLVIIAGGICLAASVLVGMYNRRVIKGVTSEPDKNTLIIAQALAIVSFIVLLLPRSSYLMLSKSWTTLTYLTSLVCTILSIKFAYKTLTNQNIKRISIWSLIVVCCILSIFSVLMLLGIAMNIP